MALLFTGFIAEKSGRMSLQKNKKPTRIQEDLTIRTEPSGQLQPRLFTDHQAFIAIHPVILSLVEK